MEKGIDEGANGVDGGQPMSIQRYLAAFGLLIVAGNETTRNSISGGLLALAPGMLRSIPSASHIAQWSGPVAGTRSSVTPFMHMRSTATEDTAADTRSAGGQKVVFPYCSVNRDEEVFERPSAFTADRRGPCADWQMGFGIVEHYCLGVHLAELQLRIVFEELLGRFPEIRPVGEVRRLRSNFISGVKEMRVVTGEG